MTRQLALLVAEVFNICHDMRDQIRSSPVADSRSTHGLPVLLLYVVLSFAALFLLVSNLPPKAGLAGVFAISLSSFFGASTWFDAHWNFGAKAPIIYAILLSTTFVFLTFLLPAKTAAPIATEKLTRR